jgi:hypothetical protein
MGYYLRAFCASPDIPSLRSVFEWAEGQGVRLDAPSADLDAAGWHQAEVVYKSDSQPFVAEAAADELLREEVEEFLESLDDVDESPEKRKVVDHLEQSKALVAAELLGDLDDAAYTAAGTFLTYFVEHCGGMIQADGEGFYEGQRLIVEVD